MVAFKNLLRYARNIRTVSTFQPNLYPPGFNIWPSYFSIAEQRALLVGALHKLDATEPRRYRQRRKIHRMNTLLQASMDNNSLQDLFFPDDFYQFQEGHFDGVIHHFREMHVSSWPEGEVDGLSCSLQRLFSLCPSPSIQTHLLHLASYGSILPHVDNISASGSWILGVSLGDERILHLEGVEDGRPSFDIALPSGSVYLQRDEVRYGFTHSIARKNAPDASNGQRLSIMIRYLVLADENIISNVGFEL